MFTDFIRCMLSRRPNGQGGQSVPSRPNGLIRCSKLRWSCGPDTLNESGAPWSPIWPSGLGCSWRCRPSGSSLINLKYLADLVYLVIQVEVVNLNDIINLVELVELLCWVILVELVDLEDLVIPEELVDLVYLVDLVIILELVDLVDLVILVELVDLINQVILVQLVSLVDLVTLMGFSGLSRLS